MIDIENMGPPDLVRLYIGVRDAKDAKKKAYEADTAPLVDLLDNLEAKLHSYMNTNGLKSVPTAFGTAIQTTKTNATVSDWDAFYAFIQKTGRLDFLQKRVASTALAEFTEESATAPPGVSFFIERQVQVRRPKS